MVPAGYAPVSRFAKRAGRARALAERLPPAREALLLYASISEVQAAGGSRDELAALFHPRTAPEEWFERVAAELSPPEAPEDRAENECPRCGNPPQLGVLRPQGNGAALTLGCAICAWEWSFPRGQCPACGASGEDAVAFLSAEELPAVRTQTCESCRTYLHLIDLGLDPAAVPEADEISAMVVDAYCLERGFSKLCPNLIGL
jgi:FdhE protein